jgi:hypothetical protein
MKLQKCNKASATALIVVLSVLATLLVTVAIAVEYTTVIHRNVQRSRWLENAIAIGDGSTDMLFGYWRETCRGNTNYPMPTSYFAAIPLPTSAQFPDVTNFSATSNVDTSGAFTISNYKVQAVDPQLNSIASDVQPPPSIGMSANSATYNYLASADVTLPALRGNLTAKVRRVFQKQQLSPWNWAIFYVDVLEMHPGPPFTVTGWVHTNGDLYTGHNTLSFADKVTYGRDWTIGFAPGDPRSPSGTGPETPTSPSFLSNLPPAMDVAHQPFGLDSTRILSTADTNPNNDSYHELIEQAVSGYSDPLAGSRYYDQAGVKITIDSSNNVTIRNAAGTVVTNSSTGSDKQLYTAFSSAMTTNQTIQDNREASSIRLATLDVSKVTSAIANGTLTNFNDIIYITDTSAAANGVGAKRGIRLKNGTILPQGGLTIASGNPVYIQGDYNTGGANPPSNSGNYSQPQVSGYTRQPSSVVADAVSILSNSWTDANSFAGLSSRIASNTTVNTAILAGIIPSAGNVYSGGAENFPRFLEDWSGGKTLTYYGSMVELYKSQQSIGTWGKDNVYNPPNRQWFFDKTFQVYTPPGSLMVYSYVKGRWFLAP